MKKLFLVCLMMLAGSAWAEWVMYEESDLATHYFDPATIRKDGNIRRMWELWDFKKRDKYGAMSGRWRTEFDCKLERYRNLGFSIHSDPMAGGTVLLTGGEDNTWMAIAPDTRGATALNIVCAK